MIGIMCWSEQSGAMLVIVYMSAPAGLSVVVLTAAGCNCLVTKADWSHAYKTSM